ncbi:MAG TPA: Tad domain-containing protein [Candidatus Limnocylindrales bacterium]|nr:Tad domain-containing protein [Candidatus Limnocylindrales bacterium]
MPQLGNRDRGGATTIVAVLVAGGVLLGMAALTVDIGQLYAEREQLQSGADAAATRVATECAKHRIGCTAGTLTIAESVTDRNAADGRSNVNQLCGRDAHGRLSPCVGPDNGNLTDCIGTIPPGVNYVQVRTRTEVAENKYVLPFAFAQTLVGNSTGTTVAACSRVAYGPPKSGLALTISACEYERVRTDTVNPPPWPPNPPAAREVAVGVHGGMARTCSVGPPSGWDQPGGFGWLDESGGPCRFLVDPALDYGGDTGASPSPDCRSALTGLRDSHQPVAMPIYDGQRGSGSNAEYHLHKLGAFVVTGYHLPGLSANSNVHPSFDPCRGSDTCIYGYFVDIEFLPGDVGPDPGTDLGLLAIKTIG